MVLITFSNYKTLRCKATSQIDRRRAWTQSSAKLGNFLILQFKIPNIMLVDEQCIICIASVMTVVEFHSLADEIQ